MLVFAGMNVYVLCVCVRFILTVLRGSQEVVHYEAVKGEESPWPSQEAG